MKKILILSAVVFLAACSGKKDPKAELADLKKQQADLNAKITALQATVGADSVKSTDVNVAILKAGTFTNYIQIQGKVDAQDNVIAFPQVPSGTITAINVKPGDHVSKGQVLVQLDAAVLKQNIAAAQTKADLSKALYQRQKNLWDQKIGTEVQYLTSKTTMEGDQKQVDVLRQQANQYRIISPINGTVDQMDLKLGQSVSAANGIRIVNADNLKIKADVPESYGTQINTGDAVKVLVPDAADSINAKLTFAAKVIDPTSRSFAVEVKLPQRKGIRPNMTAILKIVNYQNSRAISIPVKAIQKSEAGDYVYLAVNGIAKRTNVKAGATYGGTTEILSGLKEGDQLVTDGASDIEDGSKIKIVKSGN